MKIKNQDWIEEEKHIVLTLKEPYWGAWNRYGWEHGVEGLSISESSIFKAMALKKKIKIKVIKYGTYEITANKAYSIGSKYKFRARDGTRLFCLPRTELDRVGEPIISAPEPEPEKPKPQQLELT
jgi:hypothetical protein